MTYLPLGLARFIQNSPGLARFLNSEIKEKDEDCNEETNKESLYLKPEEKD